MVARTTTGNMQQARKLADLALDNQKTVHADVLVEKFGSLETCKSLARGIQKSFASMRSVERDREANKVFTAGMNNKELWVKSKYDSVTCRVYPLPNGTGWRAEFSYAELGFSDIEVSFADGGKPLDKDMDALFNRIAADITQVAPADVVACAEHSGCAGDDIPNLFVGGFVEIQQAEDWMTGTFMPWWRERTTTGQPLEENAVSQQQGC